MTHDKTTAALDEAIRAYAAAERPGDYVAAWVMVAATAIPHDADADGYLQDTAPGQAMHTTLGTARLRPHPDAPQPRKARRR